jgi:hypothetical protein
MSTSTSIPACTRIADDGTGPPRPVKNVISFDGSPTYLPELMNWVAHFWRVCKSLTSLYVICIGQSAVESLTNNQWGLKCDTVLQKEEGKLVNVIWYERLQIYSEVMESGYDVFTTDLDALWITDPYEILNRYPGYDVIAQRAKHGYIPYVSWLTCPPYNRSCEFPDTNTWGSDFCFGIIYLRNSPEVISLLNATRHLMSLAVEPSRAYDQKAFNNIFHTKANLGHVKISNMAHIASDDYAVAEMQYEGSVVRYASIPQKDFPRDCLRNLSTASLIHCNTHQFETLSKNDVLKRFNLWALHDDWFEISYDGKDYGQYIDAISDGSLKPGEKDEKLPGFSMTTFIGCKFLRYRYPSENCKLLEKKEKKLGIFNTM